MSEMRRIGYDGYVQQQENCFSCNSPIQHSIGVAIESPSLSVLWCRMGDHEERLVFADVRLWPLDTVQVLN